MDQKILHDVENHLHQILSYCERVADSDDCSSSAAFALKIKKSAYAIDAIMSDYSDNKEVDFSKNALEAVDFERFAGLKILIVDDIPQNIEIMRNIFKAFSCEVVSANSGEEALELYKGEFSPDVVCMDVVMQGMDGAQTTKKLKRLGSKAFFVAVSALKNQPTSVLSIFDYWLPKPFTVEQIVQTLRMFESRKNSPSAEDDFIFALELDEETKKQFLGHAKNGAYTSLATLVQTLQETPSKAFLLQALKKMNFEAIKKSIISP